MTEGEIRAITCLEELRELSEHTVIADARRHIGALRSRSTSRLPGAVFWVGFAGRYPLDTIVYPVQAWWPAHPELMEASGG